MTTAVQEGDPLPDSPAELMEYAWANEAGLRLAARSAALDRVQELLDSGDLLDQDGRDWPAELAAERAVDAARLVHGETAQELAAEVLATTTDPIALARATEALGRAFALVATDHANRRAESVLLEAVDRYEALGRTEWQGYALFCIGAAVHLQTGDLDACTRAMEHALAVLAPHSARRPTVLSFYSDMLIALGEWHRAEQALSEAEDLAQPRHDQTGLAYAAWSRAKMASARGDAMATVRYLREAERAAGDTFREHTLITFLADGAELLDRVGSTDQAEAYLRRAEQLDPQDIFVQQARAALLARGGDPQAALAALDAVEAFDRGRWLDKRLRWRHTLLTAWATLRSGGDAGELAARALQQAHESGGVRVALATEPELTTALAPPAEAAGSAHARALLLGKADYLVRLFGEPRIVRGDGSVVPQPSGQAAELLRLVAMHPYGVAVEVVLEAFFPDVADAAARHRLRQMLSKLRAGCGELVVRQDDRLALAPAWVDVHAFTQAADRARGARGSRAAQLAYTALAVWTGPPLPADVYAEWADSLHDRLRHRYLTLLDVVAADAKSRGSHQEALTALTTAIDENPDEPARYTAAVPHLRALGRHETAEHFEQRGR
jgi:DNA-binding SARP family transcriptional activator